MYLNQCLILNFRNFLLFIYKKQLENKNFPIFSKNFLNNLKIMSYLAQ